MINIPAKVGDLIFVQPTGHSGGAPVRTWRAQPPSDPVMKAFWKKGFYRKTRVKTLDDLRRRSKDCTAYNIGIGDYCHSGSIFIGNGVAVAYEAVMEWQRGVPFAWWADETATPEEANRVIDIALNSRVNSPAETVV
jgi:hypothetical protein